MTEYEKHSLKLLAAILNGISLQVTKAGLSDDPQTAIDHTNLVLRWQETVKTMLDDVGKVLAPRKPPNAGAF